MKIKNILLAAATGVVLSSCGAKEVDYSDPRSVTEGFVVAISEGDFDKAKEMVTEKSRKAVTALADKHDASKDDKLDIVHCEEPKNDKCKCTATMKSGETTKYKLEKEGEKWKLKIEKGISDGLDMIEGEIEGAIEEGFDEAEDILEEAIDNIIE